MKACLLWCHYSTAGWDKNAWDWHIVQVLLFQQWEDPFPCVPSLSLDHPTIFVDESTVSKMLSNGAPVRWRIIVGCTCLDLTHNHFSSSGTNKLLPFNIVNEGPTFVFSIKLRRWWKVLDDHGSSRGTHSEYSHQLITCGFVKSVIVHRRCEKREIYSSFLGL